MNQRWEKAPAEGRLGKALEAAMVLGESKGDAARAAEVLAATLTEVERERLVPTLVAVERGNSADR